eukprot:s10733_g3.t1
MSPTNPSSPMALAVSISTLCCERSMVWGTMPGAVRHPGITTSSFTRIHLKTSARALQADIMHVLAQA